MLRRTPPIQAAVVRVQLEPQRRSHRAPGPAVAGARVVALPPVAARIGQTETRQAGAIASPSLGRYAVPVTLEPRWYSRELAAGSTAHPVPNIPAIEADRRNEPAGETEAAFDRRCAAATMIIAASVAVAVSFIVAPRLRNTDLPVQPAASAVVAEGAAVYAASCAGCHGADLKGGATDGTAAAPAPPPLDASGHAWLHSDATLFRMVKNGIANCAGDGVQPRMPSFADRLDERSIQAALAFLKSRWPRDLRIVQNAFNDGASDTAESQEAVLCVAICEPPARTAGTASGAHVAAR